MHVLTLAPVDRAGRPVKLETEKSAGFLNLKNFVKIVLMKGKLSTMLERVYIHDLNMISIFVKFRVLYIYTKA